MLARTIAGAFAAAIVVLPQPVAAHAELKVSNPENGSALKSLPEQVTLELNEPVKEPAFVVVTDEFGDRVNSEKVLVSGRKVSSAVTDRGNAGRFTMSYRIVSADAHAVSGTVQFSVSQPASETPTPSAEPTSTAGDNVDAEARESRSNTAAIVFILLTLVAITGLSILMLLRLVGRAAKG